MSRVFHSDSRSWSNFVPAELVKLCGVPQGRWPEYAAKELIDNACAALEEHGVSQPIVWFDLNTISGVMTVSDNGPGIDDEVLEKILDFDSFGGSNRHHKLPTRGAQGNAFMTIVGAVAAWSPDPWLRVGRRGGPEVKLSIELDSVRQEVSIAREEVGPPGRSSVSLPIPRLPWKRGGSTAEEVSTLVKTMAWMNPHITFIIRMDGMAVGLASDASAGPALDEDVLSGSAAWFTSEEFAQRLAADVRARPETTLVQWMREFRGTPRAITHQSGDSPIGALSAGMSEPVFKAWASALRDSLVKAAQTSEPKFAPIGAVRLSGMMEALMGCDPECGVQYEQRSGTFQSGDAVVPYHIEVALMQMPEGVKTAPDPVLCMNRTALYGSPPFRGGKWREKVRGDWHDLNGDLGAFSRAYQIDHGKTPAAVVVHATCPSPGYAGYGKQQFDTSWMVGPLSECLERVTLQVRKQRAGESRPRKSGDTDSTIREVVFRLAPDVWDRDTEGGRLPIMIRQLFYGVRKLWAHHHHKKLEYQTFCVYISEWEQKVGRNMCLRDPRGTMVEPHSGRSLRLGTDEVAKYTPKKWEGHTIIFVEKEGFAHILRDYGILRRYDAIVIGSKGFAVESCREVLQKYQKLLGGMVKIIALHDADPAGYMIGHDLATNLPRFGDSVHVNVIDVGLTVEEAQSMGLQDEPFDLKKSVWSMVKNMRKTVVQQADGVRRPMLDQAAWDAFMPPMMRGDEYPEWVQDPQGRRVELNAMAPRQFIDWLEGHLEANECRKVRPPDEIVNQTMLEARKSRVTSEVGKFLMELIGDDAVHEILKQVGVPTFDLDAVLANKPEQNWEYLSQRAGQTGMDLSPILKRVIGEKLGGSSG